MTDTDVTRPPKPLGFTELKTWLRHRHPMILLDRVIDHEPGVYLTGLLSVSGQVDALAGHFPERAIYPASHLSQAFAQAGIVLYQMSTSPLTEDEITLVGSMRSRFMKIVVPGDQVVFHVRNDGVRDNTFQFSCRATVDGKPVAAFSGTLVRVRVADMGDPLW